MSTCFSSKKRAVGALDKHPLDFIERELVTLTGGSGNDTFAFDIDTLGDIDIVTDFKISTQECVLHLRDVLEEYDPLADALSDSLQIADSDGNSTVSVDPAGAGELYSMTQIATLSSITGLTGN